MTTATETKSVTITRPSYAARSEASVFFDIAVAYIVKDVAALSDNGKISMLIQYASMLSGIAHHDLWLAAVEVARAEREENQSRWNIQNGQTDRSIAKFPCPVYETIRKELRGIGC